MSTVFEADGAFPAANRASHALDQESIVADVVQETSEGDAAPAARQDEDTLAASAGPEDEIEEELIIEDFTIDGICGVY